MSEYPCSSSLLSPYTSYSVRSRWHCKADCPHSFLVSSPSSPYLVRNKRYCCSWEFTPSGGKQQCVSAANKSGLDSGDDALLWTLWVKADLSEVSEAVVLCLQVLQGWSPFTSYRTLSREPCFSGHPCCISWLPSQLCTLQVSPFESGLALSDSCGFAQFWGSLSGFLLVAFFSVLLPFLLYRLPGLHLAPCL